MTDSIRLTHATLKVLTSIQGSLSVELSGSEIARATGLASGSLYPILLRLERAGLLKSHWENVDPSEVGRPRRRLYRMTGVGAKMTRAAMAELMPQGVAWAR
jgi:PadR family transcriptional regulator, regulatory protein PadR